MKKTIDIIKEKRQVSDSVKRDMKAFNKLKKQILKSIETDQKTIPEIAKEIGVDMDVVTYSLMTLIRYGFIEASEIDDNDEYYYYKLKNKK